MVTLREALGFNKEQIKDLRAQIKRKIKEKNHLGAYVEQLLDIPISERGDGIPIAIKDNICVQGWEVTCASKILKGYISPFSSTVVENMDKRGLSPLGRCNMDEFAMGSSTENSCYGFTKNPKDLKKVPGGSSGGGACAVASGIAIAALGSDTGGSVRQPSAFCGCVGMKPTYGSISRYGLVAYSSSLDQIGSITQDVQDAAILYDIISSYDVKDSTSYPNHMRKFALSDIEKIDKKLNIAIIKDYVDDTDSQIKNAIYDMIDKLKKDGHNIFFESLVDAEHSLSAYYVIANAEASSNLSRFDGVRYGNRVDADSLKDMYIKTRSAGFGNEVKRRILLGTFVLSSKYQAKYYIKAQKVRTFIKSSFRRIFKDADLILTPTTPKLPFKFGDRVDPVDMYKSDIYTTSINLASLPAISIPIAYSACDMPIALQLIANYHEENTLFKGGLLVERLSELKPLKERQ